MADILSLGDELNNFPSPATPPGLPNHLLDVALVLDNIWKVDLTCEKTHQINKVQTTTMTIGGLFYTFS